MKFAKRLLDRSSVLLTGLGCGCFVKAIVEAVKATPKAEDRYLKKQIEKTEKCFHDPDLEPMVVDLDDLTLKEKITACGPVYIPTVCWALAGIGLCMGTAIADQRKINMLSGSLAAVEAAFADWREKAKIVAGDTLDARVERVKKAEKTIKDNDLPPFDDKQTFYIEGHPFFEKSFKEVIQAEYALNRKFAITGSAKLNDLYELLGLRKTRHGNKYGWDMMSGEAFYGYGWIDFWHRFYIEGSGLTVCAIEMPFAPHPLFEYDNYYEELARDAEGPNGFRNEQSADSAKKSECCME